ncbi:MAG: PRC-barrel domain-containing protein [Burkholderiaceae bacterium]
MNATAQGLIAAADDAPKTDDSPEARMNRRFPQKVRIGFLVGLPVIDDDYGALGDVVEVVRTPAGKILLIVLHGGWLGYFGRKVAVPIEVVAILGKQIASLDMQPPAYRTAPTWTPGRDSRIPDDEIIRIALTKR